MELGQEDIITILGDERENKLYGDNATYKHHNLFIEAGAGAGKTETVINLIVDQLYQGVPPERIVAITFTNKATEELLSRIATILTNKLKDDKNPLNSDQKNILRNALNNLYKMHVSTIHHFCNVILSENSYAAKLSFNCKMLEEDEEQERQEAYYYEWFRKLDKNQKADIYNSIDDSLKKIKSSYALLCKQFDDIKVNDEVKTKKDIENKIINKYALLAWDYYKKNRDRMSLCNNQLIYEAYQLLENNPQIKDKIASQYDVIFIDEFQDTDKYQNKFIINLAIAINKRKQAEGKLSTSLVVVGDPKQSIYGFRGADFQLFMDTRKQFNRLGLKNAINVFFPDNYRSNNYILNWVNDIYKKKLFYDGYKYEDMKCPKNHEIPSASDSNALAGVYSYNFNGMSNKFEAYAKLVKKIKETRLIYHNKNKDAPSTPRKIKYSDFLILTTSHSEINEFILAFNKENINTLVAGEFNLSSSTAFNYIYRVLMYVLNDDKNLDKLFVSNFNRNLYEVDKLNKIKEDTNNFNAYGKFIYVLNNIDLILGNFEESDKSLLKTVLNQVCDNVSYDKKASSIKILKALDSLFHYYQEAQISLEPNQDAVQIMNVHKAKGLTAEIVIVADSGGFKSSCDPILNGTLYLNNRESFEVEIKQCKKAAESERLRLEYVAATRAKQVIIFESDITARHLFNLHVPEKDEDKDYIFTEEELKNYHIKDSVLPVVNEKVKVNNKGTTAKRINKQGLDKIDNKLLNPIYIESSPSLLEEPGTPLLGKKTYKRPANNIFGTIFHRIMELYVCDPAKNINLIVEQAINENILSVNLNELDDYRKYLNECAQAVISLYKSSNIFNQYNQRMPEFKFVDYSDTLYGPRSTLMSGSMDLLLISNNKVLIIDYKTDTNHFNTKEEFETELNRKYKNQLSTYKKVISKFYGIPTSNIETTIVWLEENSQGTIAQFCSIN